MNPLSKRKLFNAILPEKKIVDHLDALHLGYLAKRKARVNLAKKFENSDKFDKLENFRSRNRTRGRLLSDVIEHRRAGSPYPFNREGKFLFKASDWKSVPRSFPGSPPEVAIIGRSNVGKSTLLNSLLSLEESPLIKALVSDKPGETRHLQFYCVGRNEDPKSTVQGEAPQAGPALVITDMPGFGFAYMNPEDLLRCNEITKNYLTRRGSNLKRVLLLLDARHGLKVGDEQFFRELFATTSSSLKGGKAEGREQPIFPGDKGSEVKWKLQVVLTKCDLVERFELARRIQVLKQKIKEILPRIGYTSLPILAVSSLENRGIIELMKELASMTVRGSLPVKGEEDLVEKAFELQRVHAANKEATEMRKVTRSWTSATKFEKRDELDRSFLVKGGTVDAALALKDSTRHKQPAGRGTWVSTRADGKEWNGKKNGVLKEISEHRTEETSLGGLNDFEVDDDVYQTKHTKNLKSKQAIETQLHINRMSSVLKDDDFDFDGVGPAIVPRIKTTDSWEAKALRADQERKKARMTNTSLGSLQKGEGSGSSAMTRLNSINSGADQSLVGAAVYSDSPPTHPKNWSPSKLAKSEYPTASAGVDPDPKGTRHVTSSAKGVWPSHGDSVAASVPSDKKKVVIKSRNDSGSLGKQFMERKQLLPLDHMTQDQKDRFKQGSKAMAKKERKVSIQRLERREKRDIQFGRKEAPRDTNIDVDVKGGFVDDVEVKVETKKKPPSVARKGPDTSEKKKSFSTDGEKERKMKPNEIRYANSFREKKVYGNEYSTTSKYSMGSERKRKTDDKPSTTPSPSFKDDTTYNDLNEKKPFTHRVKTKFGKVVGSKAKEKRSRRESSGSTVERGTYRDVDGKRDSSSVSAEDKVYPASTGRLKRPKVVKKPFKKR